MGFYERLTFVCNLNCRVCACEKPRDRKFGAKIIVNLMETKTNQLRAKHSVFIVNFNYSKVGFPLLEFHSLLEINGVLLSILPFEVHRKTGALHVYNGI